MGQNDASAGLQLRSSSALEVQSGDRVVADLLDRNAAERLEVGLVNDGDEELSSVRICEAVAPDIRSMSETTALTRKPKIFCPKRTSKSSLMCNCHVN